MSGSKASTITMQASRRFRSTPGSLTASCPLCIGGSGSSGANRGWDLAYRLGEAGCLSRAQSLVIYDSNQDTALESARRAQALRGTPGPRVILPEYLPSDDGFHRTPDTYYKYAGLLDRELNRQASEALRHSIQLGAPPQLVVQYVNFSGHTIVSTVQYQSMKQAFPEAVTLPVVLIPRDAILEEQMRRQTWAVYEEAFDGVPALLTDNRTGFNRDIDHRLSIGLASPEAAFATDHSNGTLADLVNGYRPFSGGWYGLNVAGAPLPLEKKWRWWPPGCEPRLRKGRAHELALQTRAAVLACMKPVSQLALHDPPPNDVPQRLTVAIPIAAGEIHDLAEDVTDQLQREGFFRAYENLTIAFASAHFSSLNGGVHLYASRFYPLQGRITSLDNILGAKGFTKDIQYTGFGSGFYLPERAGRVIPLTAA